MALITWEKRKEYFNGRCSYYNKVGHKKVDCWKLKGKQEKKGNILMIEANIMNVPMNTWWLDTGAIIHVTNSLQGMISQRGATNLKQHVHMRDSLRAKVDIMGTIKLKLAIGYVLELQEVSYVPSIRRNLLSISLLDSQGYNFFFLEITKLKCIRMVKWLVLEPYEAI